MIKFKIVTRRFNYTTGRWDGPDVEANEWSEANSDHIEIIQMAYSLDNICIMYKEKETMSNIINQTKNINETLDKSRNTNPDKYNNQFKDHDKYSNREKSAR
jgi:hypothetical protein